MSKVRLRRIGNSLGVILPRATLEAWGVGEGDLLELTKEGLRPPRRGGLSHQQLDQLRLALSLAVIRRYSAREIRAQIIANLARWERQQTWVSAYDEWRGIARSEDDGLLFAAMLGRDEDAVRLRQSMPYVGLLSQAEVSKLQEESGA
jgi:antitoxin component of MazEF toxin-antitoxin module